MFAAASCAPCWSPRRAAARRCRTRPARPKPACRHQVGMIAMDFSGKGALMLWLDVDPALRAETDTWYAAEHLPDRVGPGGYLCARRYRAIEAPPEYLTFFVAET